jgi:hypothetical protein
MEGWYKDFVKMKFVFFGRTLGFYRQMEGRLKKTTNFCSLFLLKFGIKEQNRALFVRIFRVLK